MTLYDRLLVPTDGSPEGRRAIAHALDLASFHGAAVHALYVVDTTRYVGTPMERSWEGVGDLLRDDAAEAVAEVASFAAATDIDVETAVVEGPPSAAIVDYAERTDCDLIVMGTHGRGGINRLLLGSVAEKVVRGSTVPVLTVRLTGEESPAESGTASATTEDPASGTDTATTEAGRERDASLTRKPSGERDAEAASEG
ncbi:universal stress protein [Halorubrum halophilum]|uniref:universal stress protein n=1 Tax=Halorubrum halophilum TaxID=413816 RepID=UPI00186B17C8|nr:universal stress protein [Halorubrum halophilum]